MANEIAKQPEKTEQLNASERFSNAVIKEFSSNVTGDLQINEYQKRLIQGYFVGIDRGIKLYEEARLRKNANNSDHKYDNPLPAKWSSVNMTDLAIDVVHYARMGLDMMQKNHLSPVLFRNKKTNKYDVALMPGYVGIQYEAEKYALEKPKSVTVELVYSTDIFKEIKKSNTNPYDTYEFEITNSFNRGEIIGGFGYIEYEDPTKNKLIVMTKKDIEKRKPSHASTEFWGGTKTEWKNNKKVEVQVDGWYEEMCLKTIKRKVYSEENIIRDPQKIDENYQHAKLREAEFAEIAVQEEVEDNANKEVIDMEVTVVDETPPTAESEPVDPQPEPPNQAPTDEDPF